MSEAEAAPVQGNPSVVGQWGFVNNWPLVPIHVSVLPNGKVLPMPAMSFVPARASAERF